MPLQQPDDAVRVLYDFRLPCLERGWRTVDDVVMGGASRSTFTRAETGLGIFQGELSLDHGGGFAALRSPDALDGLAGFAGIELELKSDGRAYKLNLRLDTDFDGIVYQRAFDAPTDTWTRVLVSFGELVATRRGRIEHAARPFDPGRIRSLGLLLADRRAGPFRLELRRIAAWYEREDP